MYLLNAHDCVFDFAKKQASLVNVLDVHDRAFVGVKCAKNCSGFGFPDFDWLLVILQTRKYFKLRLTSAANLCEFEPY